MDSKKRVIYDQQVTYPDRYKPIFKLMDIIGYQIPQGGFVLDAGSFNGQASNDFLDKLDRPDVIVNALDITFGDRVERANLLYKQGSYTNLDFPSDYFDLIIFGNNISVEFEKFGILKRGLHAIQDRLSSAIRTLARGGIIVILDDQFDRSTILIKKEMNGSISTISYSEYREYVEYRYGKEWLQSPSREQIINSKVTKDLNDAQLICATFNQG